MMTELETMERARMYMEKLAKGINPIDGSLIPDCEVVNNVRLSRCFFYVADVLRQVIDNGGVTAPKKQEKVEKLPFALSPERRADFAFSESPIPISELTKRINALVDTDSMLKLSYSVIRDWLITTGFLEEVTGAEGKSEKRPSPQGEAFGIILELRNGLSGSYNVILYTLKAQQFIVDNLDAILDWNREKTENKGKPWTAELDAYLAELYRKGHPVGDIAVELKRNSGAVRARLRKLGLLEQ